MKLLSTIILIFSITFAHNYYSLGIGLITILISIYLSKLSFDVIKNSVGAPLTMLVVMSPFILLTPGYSFLTGLVFLSNILIKSITIFILFTILINTSSISKLISSMSSIGIPKKLILILISTYRYIFLYRADLKKLLSAAKLRGFTLQKGFKHSITSADILLTLIIRSYEQSQRVNSAMKLRGFTGDYKTIEKFNVKFNDILLFVSVIVISIIIIILEIKC